MKTWQRYLVTKEKDYEKYKNQKKKVKEMVKTLRENPGKDLEKVLIKGVKKMEKDA